ncbi:MAG: UDP-N-acetylmuramate dehydrogenase [Betaproteobacteria bacterium]|nr:UDP-N-acetylmuramate dehydrogenase [Betaproteobacteria bacterium]
MNAALQLNIEPGGLRGELRLNEPMGRHVSWRTGGVADRCYVPADTEDLSAFLQRLDPQEPVLFVGLGSNLLVRDRGFRGTVILTHGSAKRPELILNRIYAEAGVASPKVARFAVMNGLTGAEFLAGIPGTVGGALTMNAGCFGGECWDIVDRAMTIDRQGHLKSREKGEFRIGYRHCELKEGGRLGHDEWFVGAYFRLVEGDTRAARAKIREFLARRAASQPLQLPNAGSVFRNPIGDHAARLIETCGLKGLERGGARVSEKHANFIVNPKGGARASDIEALIETVRESVRQQTGMELESEVRIVGEPE